MAEFYEQYDLKLDALTSYEYAIMESPDVDYFKDAYLEFLMRNGYSNKIDWHSSELIQKSGNTGLFYFTISEIFKNTIYGFY